MLGYSGKTSKLDESSWVGDYRVRKHFILLLFIILTLKVYSVGNFHLVGVVTRSNRVALKGQNVIGRSVWRTIASTFNFILNANLNVKMVVTKILTTRIWPRMFRLLKASCF